MNPPSPTNPAIDDLAEIRRQRAELRDTLGALERALAAAGSGRAVVWGEGVLDAVTRLASDFAEHVVVTEGPDGLHQSILAGDLRLSNAVRALTAEHAQIAADIAELAARVQPPVGPGDVADVRERGTHLLGRLARHRQRGADLVYEAFQTDIGGAG